jgi:hypothetical protein
MGRPGVFTLKERKSYFPYLIINIRKALAQEGFADPPHTGEPDHRALLPRLCETVYLRMPLYHMTSCWLKMDTIYNTNGM